MQNAENILNPNIVKILLKIVDFNNIAYIDGGIIIYYYDMFTIDQEYRSFRLYLHQSPFFSFLIPLQGVVYIYCYLCFDVSLLICGCNYHHVNNLLYLRQISCQASHTSVMLPYFPH